MAAPAISEPLGRRDGQPERPDVFISYSRHDESFVRGFVAALEERGKDVWVDWEDIRKSADWRAKIEEGVESARAIVAVLTPEFVASEVCSAEMAHAVAQNKRIVPVVLREPDKARLRDELNAPNWIFLREGDDFVAGVDEIVEAVEADLEWLDQHARLLVRALEWDRQRRNPSFLLRGSDLDAAEDWLASQGAHKESATALQGEYIVASRRAATKRQRITLGAIALALVVAIALALFALLQRDQAIAQRDKAISKGAALQALADLDGGEFDRAVLLSLEAVRTKSTFEARSAAVTVLERTDRIQALLRNPSHTQLDGIAVSPDGRLVAVGGLDREIHVWDVATRRLYCPPLRLGSLDEPTWLTFGRHGRQLVAGYNGSNTTIWSLSPSRAVAVPLHGRAGYAPSAAVSPDGRTVATAGYDGGIDIWDPRTGAHRARVRDGQGSPFSDVAFVNSRLLADYTSDFKSTRGVLTTRDWRTGRVTARRRLPGSPLFEAFSVDGDRLLTFSRKGYEVWDVRSQRRVGAVSGAHGAVVAIGPHGRTLALRGDDGEITVWDVRTGEQRDFPLRGDARATVMAFSWDGTRIVTGGNGLVAVWRLTAGSDLSNVLAGDPQQELGLLEQSLHGAVAFGRGKRGGLVWANEDGLTAWASSTSRIIGRRRLSGGGFNSFAVSPDGRAVAGAEYDHVRIWRFDRRPPTDMLPLGANAVAYSPDGRFLASGGDADDGSVRLWDAHSGAQLGKPVRTSRNVVWDVAFNPTGTALVSVGYGDVVSRWSVEDAGGDRPHLVPARPNRLRGHSGAVEAAAFSPDSRLLATGDHVGTIWLWDAATGRPVGEPLTASGSIEELAFDPGSAVLASAADDGTIRLWDVENRRELGGPLRAHVSGVTSLAFRADGEILASTDANKAVVVWDPVLWTSDWSRIAHRLCPILSRNLTGAEWKQFLPGQPHRATCAQ